MSEDLHRFMNYIQEPVREVMAQHPELIGALGVMFLSVMMGTVLAAFVRMMETLREYKDTRVRTITIGPKDLCRDESGQACVRIWRTETNIFSWYSKVMYYKHPSPTLYSDIAFRQADTKCTAVYTKKLKGCRLIDVYTDIRPQDPEYQEDK